MSHIPYGSSGTAIQTSPTSVEVVLHGEQSEASFQSSHSSHFIQLNFRKYMGWELHYREGFHFIVFVHKFLRA